VGAEAALEAEGDPPWCTLAKPFIE